MQLKDFIIIAFIIFSTNLFCQDITFDNSEVFFEHPRTENSGLGYPYIPLDYNADGIVDFIGGTFNDQFLFKGLENNNFEQIDIYQGFAHNPLKVMDFDNDGDQDVIMEKYINSYETGDEFEFISPSNLRGTIVEVADFNNDGLNDLLVHDEITFEDDDLTIYYNEGDNTFTPEVIFDKNDYNDIEIGDIDGDGDIDIAMMYSFDPIPIMILFNNEGTFVEQVIPYNIQVGRTTLKLHDLDLDNDLDIITLGSDDIYILENDDNFSNAKTFKQSEGEITYFNVADLNNDSFLDIVTISKISDNLEMHIVAGEGGFDFKAPKKIETFAGNTSIFFPNFNYVSNNLTFYDIDQDGALDIVYTDGFSEPNAIRWLKNTSSIISSNQELSTFSSTDVFPNPTEQYLEIKDYSHSDQFQYNIISMSGEIVFSGTSNNNQINVSNLSTGMYLIKSEELNLVKRFIKH